MKPYLFCPVCGNTLDQSMIDGRRRKFPDFIHKVSKCAR